MADHGSERGYGADMGAIAPPDQSGRGLVNLVAEVERRLTSHAVSDGLASDLAALVPSGRSCVLVLFDGLGAHQLDHRAASELAGSHAGTIDAPFPTTTTVSLATVATGRPPSQHGLIAYAMKVPPIPAIVNTIHMRSVWGDPIPLDPATFLPGSTLWSRVAAAGIEPVVVQPGNFAGSPLTAALYGGARFEPYYGVDDLVEATVIVASPPRRLVFVYVPFVDVAAHMHGQVSDEYSDAMTIANRIWAELARRLGDDVTLLGTADHGHVDIAESGKVRLTEAQEAGLVMYGDARALYVDGDPSSILAAVPSTWVPRADLDSYWGPTPIDDRFADRLPDGVVFPDDGWAVFPRYMNDRLVGYHGGLSAEERAIPLLVRRG